MVQTFQVQDNFMDKEKGTREIRCFLCKRQVFIHTDDLPWLLTYINDEVRCAGVGGLDEIEPEASEEEEDSAIAAPYSMKWDFQQKAWVGTFTCVGKLQGKQATCTFADFTEAKYEDMRAKRQYDRTWATARKPDVRNAMLHFLQEKMTEKLAEDAGGAAAQG